jgi:signal transduction histidine kinase
MTGLSLRARLTAWYVAGLVATLLAIGALVDRMLVRAFDEEFDERLTSAAGVVRFAARDMSSDVGPLATAARLLKQLRFVEVDVAIVGQSAGGAPLPFAGSDSMLVQLAPAEPCRDRATTRELVNGAPYRFLIQCVPVAGSQSPLTVIVGTSERELVATRNRVRDALILALLAGVVVTVVGGHWLSGKAIEPIRRMSERIQHIRSQDLGERLPVKGGDGEIAQLARMVNDLFDRLAAMLARERQFLANAAHALRTPMAILQAQVSEATQDRDLTAAARDALGEIGSLTSHLGRTVEYLLSLADREAGIGSFPLESVFLDDVVSGTVARLSRLAERRRIRVVWSELGETAVQANVHIVDQITQILLENALQYTPEGGTVTVSVRSEDGRGRLAVEDNGPGLEAEEFALIFTPFARGAAARRTGAPGSGLGLAVARWMIECCRGTIAVEQVRPHGARFVVTFPGVAR